MFFYLSSEDEAKLKIIPQKVDRKKLRKFCWALKKVKEGIPVQYVTKSVNFYGRQFYIERGVFIPRLDSEYLIEIVKDIIRDEDKVFLDLCCGSGALAITLLLEFPNLFAYCVDISRRACKVTAFNAKQFRVGNRLKIIRSNLFDNLGSRFYNFFDFIVCNPPYIPKKVYECLPKPIHYEPSRAIVAGKDGMNIIRKIFLEYDKYLKRNGFFLLEFPMYNLSLLKGVLKDRKIECFKVMEDNNIGVLLIRNDSKV
jgi:release factor glutamine methyltransferase